MNILVYVAFMHGIYHISPVSQPLAPGPHSIVKCSKLFFQARSVLTESATNYPRRNWTPVTCLIPRQHDKYHTVMALQTSDQKRTTKYIHTSSPSTIGWNYCSQQLDKPLTMPQKTQQKLGKSGAANTPETTLQKGQPDSPGRFSCYSVSPSATYQKGVKDSIRKACASAWCMTSRSVIGMSDHITPLGLPGAWMEKFMSPIRQANLDELDPCTLAESTTYISKIIKLNEIDCIL